MTALRPAATRELAARDAANGTDSTDHFIEMCKRFPAEAPQHVAAYAESTRYARAVANGEWPVQLESW